jgi:aminopeptidase N
VVDKNTGVLGKVILELWTTTMLHEAAHQWFGDSVSPREWSDVWLNEGHAQYSQWAYAAEHGGMRAASGGTADTLDGAAKYQYEFADINRQVIEPVASRSTADSGTCSARSKTTAARSCSMHCVRRSARRPSKRSSASG